MQNLTQLTKLCVTVDKSAYRNVTFTLGYRLKCHRGDWAFFAHPHSPWQRGLNEKSVYEKSKHRHDDHALGVACLAHKTILGNYRGSARAPGDFSIAGAIMAFPRTRNHRSVLQFYAEDFSSIEDVEEERSRV